MTQDELKMVLEALKWCHGGEPCGTAEAIAVVEKSLAQPEQELCVHAKNPKGCYRVRCQLGDKCVDDEMSFRTTPPQRTWVGLTDEEIDNINYTSAHMLAKEVEVKLKERNQ